MSGFYPVEVSSPNSPSLKGKSDAKTCKIPLYPVGGDTMSYSYAPVGGLPQRESAMVCEDDGGCDSVELEKMKAMDLVLKKRIRILRLISRLLSTCLSIFIATTMSITLNRYLNTRNDNNAWPPRTIVWPTLLLFSISATTLLLNLSITLPYLFSNKNKAVALSNSLSSFTSYVTVFFWLIHTTAWVVSSVLFKAASTRGGGRDIWGWSCGGSDNLDPALKAVVNFDMLCRTNTQSYYISWVSAAVEVVAMSVYIFVIRRAMVQRRLRKMQRATG